MCILMLECKGLKSNFQISVEGKPGLLCCFCFFFYYFALSLVQKTRAAKLKPITTWSLAFSRTFGIWVVFFFFEILLALDGTFLSSVWPLISGFVFTTLNQKAPLYRKLVIFGLRIMSFFLRPNRVYRCLSGRTSWPVAMLPARL